MSNKIKNFVLKNKKIIKFTVKSAVSAVLIFLIIFKVNWRDVLANVTKITWWQITAYAATILIGIAISAVKWKKLAQVKNINLSLWHFYKYYLTGTFINNFMPSFIGGDTYRSYETGKPEGKYIEAASAVLMDRITGFIALLFLTLFFSFLNYRAVLSNPILLLLNLLVVAFFSTDLIMIEIQKMKIWPKIKTLIPKYLQQLGSEIKSYNNKDNVLTKTVILGIIFNAIGVGLANLIIIKSLGIQISALNFCSVVFLISIISALPVSINNIGIKEWAYIALLGLFGIGTSAAVTAAILGRFMQMIISFLALPFYLRNR